MFVAFRTLWLLLIFVGATATTKDNTTRHEGENDKTIEDETGEDYSFLVIGGYRPQHHTLAKYIVSVRVGTYKKFLGDNHNCGGSIIGAHVILTAAHCLTENKLLQPSVLTVVVGSPFLLKETSSTRTYPVIRMLMHPVYSPATMRSDLGLLILAKDIDLNDDTRSIAPLIDTSPSSGLKCVSFGWGRIFPRGPRPAELVYVNLTLMKRSVCSASFPMNPTILCASDSDDPERGVWKGDSGGPLICQGKLTGVVSFGFPSADAPSFFSNVYEHRKWILENTGVQINLSFYSFMLLFSLIGFFA